MIYEKIPQVYFSLDPKHVSSPVSLQKSEILFSPHSLLQVYYDCLYEKGKKPGFPWTAIAIIISDCLN